MPAVPYIVAAAAAYGSISQAQSAKKAANASADASRRALGDQGELAGDLRYQPIDIDKLKRTASETAVENAIQSLNTERALQPDLASTREQLAQQVSSELALQGALSPDVSNRVALEARTVGGRSGNQDNNAPITASLIGLTSLDLQRQRQAAAATLLAANPLQPSGLDPGAVASAEVAQNAAMNQFNLEKAGVSSNLIDSTMNVANADAKAQAAASGAQTAMIGSLAALLRQYGGSSSTPTTTPARTTTTPTFNYSMPKTNYSLLGGASPVT